MLPITRYINFCRVLSGNFAVKLTPELSFFIIWCNLPVQLGNPHKSDRDLVSFSDTRSELCSLVPHVLVEPFIRIQYLLFWHVPYGVFYHAKRNPCSKCFERALSLSNTDQVALANISQTSNFARRSTLKSQIEIKFCFSKALCNLKSPKLRKTRILNVEG